ncbi:MAG TPA: hypothetical protein VH143_31620 [Kofleriaceae bacterium]|nr:hypothetical protein [Kofleriaceae bacterium]
MGSAAADLTCNGNAAPTPGQTITLSGNIVIAGAGTSGFTATAYADSPLSVCSGDNCATSLGTATTDCNGNFSTSVTLNGSSIDGYVSVAPSGDVATLGYAGEPLDKSESLQALVFPTSLLSILGAVVPSCSGTNTKAMIGVIVTDCAGQRITDTADITLTASQSGTQVGSAYDISQLAPDLAGFYLICNLPAGATDLNAAYLSKTFLKNTVQAVTGDATEAIVRPGY